MINQVFVLVVMVGVGPGNTLLLMPHSEHRSLPICMAAAQSPEIKRGRTLGCLPLPPQGIPIVFTADDR